MSGVGTATDVLPTIVGMLAEVCDREAATIDEQTRLAEDLHLKSLNRMELSVRFADAFGVELTVFDVLKARTVADLLDLVRTST